MENKVNIAQLKKDLKNKYQPLWDACKNSKERHKVKDDFYTLKSTYSEGILDKVWESITFETRMRMIKELDISLVAIAQK